MWTGLFRFFDVVWVWLVIFLRGTGADCWDLTGRMGPLEDESWRATGKWITGVTCVLGFFVRELLCGVGNKYDWWYRFYNNGNTSTKTCLNRINCMIRKPWTEHPDNWATDQKASFFCKHQSQQNCMWFVPQLDTEIIRIKSCLNPRILY